MPLIHMCLPVADRRQALEFYSSTFGFTPVGALGDDGIPEPLQFRLGEGTLLMLIPEGGFGWVLGDRPTSRPGTSECLLSITLSGVDEVDALAASIGSAGGTVLTAPRAQDWGYTALCADPDGHVWQLVADPVTGG
jgi:predicted lactoylglutathione lyase